MSNKKFEEKYCLWLSEIDYFRKGIKAGGEKITTECGIYINRINIDSSGEMLRCFNCGRIIRK